MQSCVGGFTVVECDISVVKDHLILPLGVTPGTFANTR